MTTILIPRDPVPVDITAEQVVAYLLRTGSGWTKGGVDRFDRRIYAYGKACVYYTEDAREANRKTALVSVLRAIASIEGRPALDVLTDIIGPAVGTVGVGCEPAPLRPVPITKLRCFWRLQREREVIKAAEKRAKMARFYHENEAPSAPEVE